MKIKIQKISKQQALTNCVYLNPDTMSALGLQENDLIIIDEQVVHMVRGDINLKENELGSSLLLWKSLHLNTKTCVGSMVTIQKWQDSKLNKHTIANTITIIIDTFQNVAVTIKASQLQTFVKKYFVNQVFCKDQRFVVKWQQEKSRDVWICLRIAQIFSKKLVIAEMKQEPDEKTDDDEAIIKTHHNQLKNIRFGKIHSNVTNCLFQPVTCKKSLEFIDDIGPTIYIPPIKPFDPIDLGVGGLNEQFNKIYRRAFVSRLYPPQIVKELGQKHCKGLLLYGPPGTGKTLIARCLGSMLTDTTPKIVNGPELLNKYVGQGEANVRALFAEAIIDEREKGDKSPLHVIIFDEIDSLCKARGGGAGAGNHDGIVNQLLAMIDGVKALNNVLIIGMTNRIDLIDAAILRPGRLGVQIEIGLPDQDGRTEIFRIHTKQIRENGYLDDNVSCNELAKRTKNYTGAEIAGVVRSAISYAMNKNIDYENLNSIPIEQYRNIKITSKYFDYALGEVLPELGKKKYEEEIKFLYEKGIFKFDDRINDLINLCGNIFRKMCKKQMNKQTLLVRGASGSGKTAITSYIGNEISEWPFVRIISSDNYIGESDIYVCKSINNIFKDSYKSNKSILILDDIERLIRYVSINMFSNNILQAILACINRCNQDNPKRKIFIFATCSFEISKQLNLNKQFDFVRDMPLITNVKQFENILIHSKYHTKCKPNMDSIIDAFPIKDNNDGVGIADLLTILQLSCVDDDGGEDIDDENEHITAQSFVTEWKSKLLNR